MGCGKKRLLVRLNLSLLAVTILLSFAACIPGHIKSDIYDLVIKNHTDEVLSIYIAGFHMFDINPGEEKTAQEIRAFSLHLTAECSRGDRIFAGNHR